MYEVKKPLGGKAGVHFSQVLAYDVKKENKQNKLTLSYSITCQEELALITNLKGKCTALLYVNEKIKEIYNGDILFIDNRVDLIHYEEIFTSEDISKLNVRVVWKMEKEYEGIDESSISTNIVVPGLESTIPVLSISIDNQNGSKRVFITTNVDKNVDFFEYKYNTGNWTRTTKDFYLGIEKERNYLQVRAKQLDGVEFGYSNVLKF